jgi:hypothetical protein
MLRVCAGFLLACLLIAAGGFLWLRLPPCEAQVMTLISDQDAPVRFKAWLQNRDEASDLWQGEIKPHGTLRLPYGSDRHTLDLYVEAAFRDGRTTRIGTYSTGAAYPEEHVFLLNPDRSLSYYAAASRPQCEDPQLDRILFECLALFFEEGGFHLARCWGKTRDWYLRPDDSGS